MDAVESDPHDRIEEILRAFEAKGAPGATAELCYRFDLEGEGGGSYLLRVGPEAVRVDRDSAAQADVTVKLTVEDFLRIADGMFDGRLAVASERIEIGGDLELAQGLLDFLEPEES